MTIRVLPALRRVQILDPPTNVGGAVSGVYEKIVDKLDDLGVRVLVSRALELRCRQVTLEVD